MYGILSGPEILKCVRSGSIEVDPFVEENVNPNSLDLTLGTGLAVYSRVVESRIPVVSKPSTSVVRTALAHDPPALPPGAHFRPLNGPGTPAEHLLLGTHLDMAMEEPVARFTLDRRGFMLLPGIMYLMHTAERVLAKEHVPVIDGKSSIGRLGIKVHLTAGYGDVGFDGQYTLEVEVTHPVLVYPGVRFCQIRFHTVCGAIDSYQEHKSNYVGELALGPVPSRAWKMFPR